MYNRSFNFILFWRELSFSYRAFVLILLAVTIHFLISVAIILKRLRGFGDPECSTRLSLRSLNARCMTLRQILGATLYLFGFLLFVGLQNAHDSLELSNTPMFNVILSNFQLHFFFAGNVFLVFLILHFLQWLASSRVQAFTQRSER